MPITLIPKTHAEEFTLPSDYLELSCSSPDGKLSSSLTIFLFGAHITSWKIDDNEILWMSSLSCMSGKGPIRGGIPIAFPQFADSGSLRLHGIVRERVWEVVSRVDNLIHTTSTPRSRTTVQYNNLKAADTTHSSSETVVLELVNERGDPEFKLGFRLQLTIELTLSSISIHLDATNTSEDCLLPFTGCLHPYFLVPDIYKSSVVGMAGMPFIDKVDKRMEKNLRVDRNEMSIAQEIQEFENGRPSATGSSMVESPEKRAVFRRRRIEFIEDQLDIPADRSKLSEEQREDLQAEMAALHAEELVCASRASNDPLDPSSAGSYFIDRIFIATSSNNQLELWHNGDRALVLKKSDSWSNWVIFNPWIEGKKGNRGLDFDDDGYLKMLCVEPAVGLTPVGVEPLQTWSGSFSITARDF